MIDTDNRTSIQQAMREAFPAYEARVATFYGMQEYHLGWRDLALQPAALDPGKLLRPQLALLACGAVGGNPVQALPLAAGIQLIHDFSLIHDDIEDNSDTRRGRVTVWKQWGLAQGINAGDGMFVVAHLALHRLADRGVPPARVLAVLRRFDETILRICEGQYLDLSFEGRLDVSSDDYLAMIERKTAALIAAAAGLGALVGGADDVLSDALFGFGHHMGMAFQIEDDILGIWGDPRRTGKPAAADVQQRKVTLPIIRALASAPERAALTELYGQASISPDDIGRVLAILDASDARAFSAAQAAEHHTAATAALQHLRAAAPPSAASAVQQLDTLATRLIGRVA